MSLEKDKKKVSLSKNSASFIPKALKQKASEEASALQGSINSTQKQNKEDSKASDLHSHENTLKFNPIASGIIPPQPSAIKSEKPAGILPFQPMIGGQINLNDLLPFAPIKPPPLLFSQIDDFMTMDQQSSNLNSQEPKKLKLITYTADFILSFKDKFKDKPEDLKEMDMPSKLSNIKKHFKPEGDLKYFKGRERGYSNYSNSSSGFKEKQTRKMTSK